MPNRFDEHIKKAASIREAQRPKAVLPPPIDPKPELVAEYRQYRGTHPGAVFDKDGSQACAEFVDAMRRRRFPGSLALLGDIYYFQTRNPSFYGANRLMKTMLSVVPISPNNKLNGYRIGSVVPADAENPSPIAAPQVFLCFDGLLRARTMKPYRSVPSHETHGVYEVKPLVVDPGSVIQHSMTTYELRWGESSGGESYKGDTGGGSYSQEVKDSIVFAGVDVALLRQAEVITGSYSDQRLRPEFF